MKISQTHYSACWEKSAGMTDEETAYLCPICVLDAVENRCVADHRLDSLNGPDHRCFSGHRWRVDFYLRA